MQPMIEDYNRRSRDLKTEEERTRLFNEITNSVKMPHTSISKVADQIEYVRRVDCIDWQRGMGASLHAGLAALPAECAGALVVLCDQPALDTDHLAALVAAWRADPDAASASSYAGRAGVPALLPRCWFDDLRRDADDHGARALLARRRDAVTLIVNEALALDIDTPAQFAPFAQ